LALNSVCTEYFNKLLEKERTESRGRKETKSETHSLRVVYIFSTDFWLAISSINT
jgi:hypothetical protein